MDLSDLSNTIANIKLKILTPGDSSFIVGASQFDSQNIFYDVWEEQHDGWKGMREKYKKKKKKRNKN